MSDLRNWVNDSLHDLVGFSDSRMAEFVIALGKREKSVDQLMKSLSSVDFPDNSQTRMFAQSLYEKFPKSTATPQMSTLKLQEILARQYARENAKFKLVDMTDEDDGEEKRKTTKLSKKEKSEKPVNVEIPEKQEKQEKPSEVRRSHLRKRKASVLDDNDDDGDDEDLYAKDQREKREFEDRLHKRDEEKTKKNDGNSGRRRRIRSTPKKEKDFRNSERGPEGIC